MYTIVGVEGLFKATTVGLSINAKAAQTPQEIRLYYESERANTVHFEVLAGGPHLFFHLSRLHSLTPC